MAKTQREGSSKEVAHEWYNAVICNKKYVFGLRPQSWLAVLKTLGIS